MNTVNPHLDDDGLSAVIDGEATPPETAHVSSCDECQHRLGHLRAAAVAAAAVPEPPPEHRERALAAAVAAGARLDRPVSHVDEVTARRRTRRPRPLVLAAGALAAAVMVVAGVAALIGDTEEDRFAAVDSDAGARVEGTDAGFLGAFEDDRDLARHLSSQLGGGEPGAAQELQSAPAAGQSGGGGGAAAGDQATATEEDSDAVAEPAPPPAGSVARLGAEAMEACSSTMLEEYPDAGERLLVGRIVWHDEAAAVFVHRVDQGERGLRAFVYAGDPCRLRTFISF